MNIVNNNQQYNFTAQQGIINVMGNNNSIRIQQSQLVVNINGNNNQILISDSRTELNLNGNRNAITARTSTLTYGFNGNNNTIQKDQNSMSTLRFCNGTGNRYPELLSPQNLPPFRNNQNRPSNNNRQRNQSTRNFMQPQYNMYENGFQQPPPQMYPPPQNNDYYYSPPYNNPPSNSFSFGGMFGAGNYFENLGRQMVTNMFQNVQGRRNYQFPPQQNVRTFNFHMYNPGYEEYQQEDVEEVHNQEAMGLTQNEMALLPRSKHSGKDGKCTICLCQIQKGEEQTFLMCFHSFHWSCIGDWLHKSVKCPVCQFNIRAHLRGQQ